MATKCDVCPIGYDCMNCPYTTDELMEEIDIGICEDCPLYVADHDCEYLDLCMKEAEEEENMAKIKGQKWNAQKGEWEEYEYEDKTGGYWSNYSTYARCDHEDWLKFKATNGGDVKIFLKSSWGRIDYEVDVYIDLTSNKVELPYVPKHLREYLPDYFSFTTDYIVGWEIRDGDPGPRALVDFAVKLITEGKAIGFGCFGGHGRTGWLAARIYQAFTGASGDEAIRFVRDNYCSKAVETRAQVEDLGAVKEVGAYTTKTTTKKGGK